jgi:hypothetical protein
MEIQRHQELGMRVDRLEVSFVCEYSFGGGEWGDQIGLGVSSISDLASVVGIRLIEE